MTPLLLQEIGVTICPQPIFIVGSPRSGTSILAWSLHEHPELWTSGESYLLFELFGNGKAEAAFDFSRTASAGSWLERGGVGPGEYLASLGLGVNALFASRSQGKRWVDHTPHYVLMADSLVAMFPDARFLHILRDGRRVVHSMVNFARRLTQAPKDIHLPPWATDFAEACRTWARYVDAGLDLCERYPDRFHTIRNEELVSDPAAAFQRAYEFLGVAPNSGPIEYVRSHRINSSFEDEDGAPPRLAAPWESWTDEQVRTFAAESGETLVRSGYATSLDTRMVAAGAASATAAEG